jgi:hypothetical protein
MIHSGQAGGHVARSAGGAEQREAMDVVSSGVMG